MHERIIFLYNAQKADAIKVNGRLIKARGKPEKDSKLAGGLRVIFGECFQDARAAGIEERIDSLFLNLDELRGDSEAVTDYGLLGHGKKICVEIL